MSLKGVLKYPAVIIGLLLICALQNSAFLVGAQAETFATLTDAQDAITQKYRVRIGLEYAPNDSDRTPIILDLSSDRIEPVLSQLVTQKSQYMWKLEDGVYDVYPKSNSGSILDVGIGAFKITNASLRQVSDAIDQLPEVKDWLAKQRVSRRELQVGPSTVTPISEVTFMVNNVTLRSLLNRLIGEFGIMEWIVERYGDAQQYIGIYM